MGDPISVIFVHSKDLEDESDVSEIMLQAFEACKQNKVNTSWIKEQDIYKKELKKTDFVVFENFEGKNFEAILEKKSASIVGPWCILVCLMEGKKIPNFQWPIYNVAMYDCIVTSSHLPKSVKIEISEKVQRMGGYYSDSLSDNTTHLISDSVKSAKYLKAIEMNIKVLTPSWVDAVWQASQEVNIHCNDLQFDKFKCLPLHKLTICTTGIASLKEREAVRKMVTENGGEFTGKMCLKSTDFLICEGDAGTMSEKYKEARKTTNVTCVTLQWLHDSIKKGYCLPPNDYAVKKKTSTPSKSFINPDFSTMSVIDNVHSDRTSIEDTISKKSSKISASSSTLSGVKRKVFTECDNLIEQIDVKKAKRSGEFLDGCSVYLVGFKEDHREKLCKILNTSGATRCDDMSDRVTHVIVGDPECHELKLIKSKGFSSAIVTLQWLMDSIERKRPCGEDSYLVNNLRDESKFKSPLGKKGLSLLRSSRTITEIDITQSQKEKENLECEIDLEAEKEIVKQYRMPDTTEEDTLANILRNANYESQQIGEAQSESCNKQNTDMPSTEEDNTLSYQPSSENLEIFQGLNFFITTFEYEQVAYMKEQIETASGSITSNIDEATFVIAPSFIMEPLIYDESMTINDLWIYDCLSEGKILPLKYYHRPLLIRNSSVLENCVVTISGYSGYERNFLSSLIQMLGGVSQEQFSRVTSAIKNVIGSTHLVTAEASGKKYEGALKWGLPAVDKDWLIGCARSETRLSEKEYSVSKKSSTFSSSKFENNSKKENQSENPSENPHVSLESLRISGKDIVPSHLLHFNRDYYNIALGITANSNPSGLSMDDAPSLNSKLEKNPFTHISNPKQNDEISCNVPPAHTTSQEVTASEADLETNSALKSASKLVPTPRKLSIGQRELRTPVSRDPFRTPDNKMDDVMYSQVTPVDKIMNEVRLTNLLGTPESPQLAKLPWDVDTPETPYGAYIDPNPSRSLRKEMLKFLNRFPDNTPISKRRVSTPLSELKRQLWNKIGSSCYESKSQSEDPVKIDTQEEEENETEKESCTQTALVNTKLQQLEEMMAAASGSANKTRRQSRVEPAVPEHAAEFNMRQSQPCTVQWDFGKDTQEEPLPQSKVFMISGIGDSSLKTKIISSLEKLGATVSETSSYDPNATHLLCPKPARNEKTLSCMAAGKWILHINYVEACVQAEKFLNEEEYEFGNSNSLGKITIELDRDIEIRMQAIHFWRNEIARTGRGPFKDMRAIIVAEKKQALVTVIEAGGGTVIEALPPFEDVVHATHCLMEPKSVSDFSLYTPLAKQGIYCVNTVYLSDFLHRINKDIKDSILPFYQKYFR